MDTDGNGLTAADLVQLPPNVVCYLSSDAQRDFANVQKGQKIEVLAKVVGTKRANVWKDFVVELEDGRLN